MVDWVIDLLTFGWWATQQCFDTYPSCQVYSTKVEPPKEED